MGMKKDHHVAPVLELLDFVHKKLHLILMIINGKWISNNAAGMPDKYQSNRMLSRRNHGPGIIFKLSFQIM